MFSMSFASTRARSVHSAVFNVTLAKVLGMYRILDPKPVVKLGGRNAYVVVVMLMGLYVCLVSAVMFANAVKCLSVDVGRGTEAVLMITTAEYSMFLVYKMLVVVRRSQEIWDCLQVTRFDFTSCGRRHGGTRLQELWRYRVVLYMDLYAIVYFSAIVGYILCPLLFSGRFSTVTTVDGSSTNYRLNVLNLYAGLSADTYNANFGAMYLTEASTVAFCLYFVVLVDTLLAGLALALICHLQTVNTAFERVADHRRDPNDTADHKAGFKTSEEHCVIYNDLKTIIKDHQAVLKKLDKLFSIFRQLILLQIITASNLLIVSCFTIIQTLVRGKLQADTGVTIIKMMLGCPLLTFHIFMACYLSELIYQEKESIIFALYSSNWIEMDMKCKKLILFTMKMNNAHRLKLKFSELRIVNLEMFLGTVRICYSIVSVMLKYK